MVKVIEFPRNIFEERQLYIANMNDYIYASSASIGPYEFVEAII